MKKNSFFYLAAAALSLTFAACSQDDIAPSADVITPDMETSYAKIKISMGSNFGTRAFNSEEEFDNGTKDEANVNSLTLMLYDDAGNLVGTGSTSDIKTNEEGERPPKDESVSDVYNATIVKVTLNPGSAKPTRMLAFVNASVSDNYNAAIGSKTAADAIGSTEKGFVMTNSGYYAEDENDASSWTIATKISEENLYATAEEAEAETPITIYVERLAAKVSVEKGDELDKNTTPENVVIQDPKGNSVTIKFNAKKWAVTALAKDMYTLKQQFDYTLAGWANNSSLSRSYWAVGTNYDTPYGDYLIRESNPLQYLSLSQIVSKDGGVGNELGQGVTYVPEHTIGDKAKNGDAFNGTLTSTSLVVVGKYVVEGESAENYKANDDSGNYQFYLTFSGTDEDGKHKYTIYNETEMIAELIDRSGLTLSTSEDGENELENDAQLTKYFKIVTDAKEYDVTLEYTGEGDELYYKNGESWTAMEKGSVDKASAKARMYYNGWAYFWGPINHNKELTDGAVGYYGVVRNHSYQITIHSFSGLGAPMDEKVGGGNPEEEKPTPENPIIPDPDDIKDAYINATLNVLSWRNIQYGVNF